MADNRKSYNAVIRGLKALGLNQRQSQVAWRNLKERLGETPRAVDLKRHPRITREEVTKAPARERALRAAKTRAEKTAAAGEKPAAKKKTAAAVAAPEMAISPSRMKELDQEWDDFDREDWDDNPDSPYA